MPDTPKRRDARDAAEPRPGDYERINEPVPIPGNHLGPGMPPDGSTVAGPAEPEVPIEPEVPVEPPPEPAPETKGRPAAKHK